MSAALDHVVLVVADVERTVSWYAREFGLGVERLDEWREGDAPFVSLRLDSTTLIDVTGRRDDAEVAGPNVDHLALVVDGEAFDAALARHDGAIEMGPAMLFGARGRGAGFYVRDPDGNRVEFRTYDRTV